MNIYAVKDLAAGQFYTVFLSDTDKAALRDNLPLLCRVKPLSDVAIFVVGDFDRSTGVVVPCSPRLVDLSAYSFTEEVMDDLNKTEAQRQIELWKKNQELMLAQRQVEIAKAQAELDQYVGRTKMRGESDGR